MNLETFDPIAYFEDRNIPYSTEGKNVTEGWANIECPFPFCNDPSNHLGINLESKLFSCWACGEKGGMDRLIQELEGCTWSESQVILGQFQENPYKDIPLDVKYPETGSKTAYLKDILFDQSLFSDPWPKMHLNYLKGRDFDPEILIPKYRLKACYNVGKYKFRIIAPVIMDNKIVSFVGMDVTRQAKIPYKNASDSESVIPIKSCLYNLDNANETVILVEGITDVWRIGDGAVATLGKKVTMEQINLLIRKGIKRVYLLPDSDAIDEWEQLGFTIAPLFDHVTLLNLDAGDPADLTGKTLRKIQDLIGK